MSSLVRKTFWPAAIVVGFLVFLGAIGYGPRSAQAETVEAICGPEVIQEDEVAFYVILVGDVDDDDDLEVTIDDMVGDTDITSASTFDGYEEFDNPSDLATDVETEPIDSGAAEDLLDEADVDMGDLLDCIGFDPDDFAEDIEDDLLAKINAGEAVLGCASIDEGNPFDIEPISASGGCADDDTEDANPDIDCPDATPTDPPFCSIDGDIVDAVAEALSDAIADEEFDCEELGFVAKNAALGAGASDEIAEQFADAVWAQCENGDLFDLGFDGIALVDVTCVEPGTFDLSAAVRDDTSDDTQAQIEVTCVGEVDDFTLRAVPATVETVPVGGSVEWSLILANLLDENDDPIVAGVSVDFSTNRCEFNDEDGLTSDQFHSLAPLFDKYSVNDPQSAANLMAAVAAMNFNDPDDVSNDVESFQALDDFDNLGIDEGDAIAAILLDCSSNSIAPGTATITAQIDQEGADITKTTTVAVVGPPASVTASASVASVICGDVAQIVVTVKDAAGQNVSEHTRVEAVTNFGGVLGGTGAVAAQAGLVTPVSSTVAETFNGVATFTLITSDTHVGNYNIVVATGGGGTITGSTSTAASLLGGSFSTPVVTANVTVACSMPAAAAPAAPTVTAPRTGTGITPPNTGDAGLVSTSSGASLSLFVIAGVAAFALAGVATLKFARR